MFDNILGRKKDFKASRSPILKEYKENYGNIDAELRRLRYVMIRDTPDNREYCFWNDSLSQTLGYMTPALITGDGIRVNAYGNTRAKTLIQDWFECINVEYQSIDDYTTHTWIDQMIHAGDYWRVAVGNDYYSNVDIQRLDPKTITKLKDPKKGWAKWVQRVPNFKSYNTKASFYKNAGINDELILTHTPRTREIHIPNEPNVILTNRFFFRPPITAATHFIVYKRFILYFMRKYSQRLWDPKLFFMVGNPMTPYYPQDDEDMQQRMYDVSTLIPDMTQFSSAVLQGDIQINEIGKNSARSSAIFVDYIDMLDKQIMLSQFSSMGLREASGNELATNRSLKESYLQFIIGIRRKYKSSLENFCANCLCKANGIAITPRQLDLEFPPLKFEDTKAYMEAIDLGVKTGVFKDRNEVRKSAQVLWGWLEELPQAQNTKYDFPVENMIKPQIIPGQTPAKKPATKKLESTKSRIMEHLGM